MDSDNNAERKEGVLLLIQARALAEQFMISKPDCTNGGLYKAIVQAFLTRVKKHLEETLP